MNYQAKNPTHIRAGLILILGALIAIAGCQNGGGSELPFTETFDEPGNWGVGEDAYSIGTISDGVYDFKVLENDISRWASAGKTFGDGVYEVEATPVEGPLDNGYGLIFRANAEKGDFYLFKISSDGFAWIGQYRDGSQEAAIIGGDWFATPAITPGLNVTNRLSVRAEAGNMIFYVNDQEVGRVTDNTFTVGDVGVLVQTLGGGGVRVLFDNLSVMPLP